MIKDFLYVGAGGALGSICRYSLTLLAASLPQGGLCATIAANVIGSFLIGMAMVSRSGLLWRFHHFFHILLAVVKTAPERRLLYGNRIYGGKRSAFDCFGGARVLCRIPNP